MKTTPEAILHICREIKPGVMPDTPMHEIVQDSLDMVDLIMRTESELNIHIDDDFTESIIDQKPATIADYTAIIQTIHDPKPCDHYFALYIDSKGKYKYKPCEFCGISKP